MRECYTSRSSLKLPMATHLPPQLARRNRRADAGIALVLLVLWVGLALVGWDFYGHDLDARLDHPAYELLRPSGLVGHGYGIVGTALILSNLLYLARRRFARAQLGSMRLWLDIHVFSGLAGGALVLFHSAFQFRTGIALMTGVSLTLVVWTGLVGRYLYALSPVADMPRFAALVDEFDQARPGLGAQLHAVLRAHQPLVVDNDASLLRKLMHVPGWWRVARQRRAGLSALLAGAQDVPPVAVFGESVVDIGVQDALAVGFTSLLQSWRAFHRMLAVLLILLVPIHVGVAWLYGYRWIFE